MDPRRADEGALWLARLKIDEGERAVEEGLEPDRKGSSIDEGVNERTGTTRRPLVAKIGGALVFQPLAAWAPPSHDGRTSASTPSGRSAQSQGYPPSR